jgi:hypothetical protein
MASIRNRGRAGMFRLLLACATGVACIVVGFFVHRQHEPYADGVSTTGTVVGEKRDHSADGVLYGRVFAFTTADGRKVSVAESEYRSRRPDVGASVEVSYLKSDPQSARIVEQNFWVPAGFIAMGALVASASLAALVSRRTLFRKP